MAKDSFIFYRSFYEQLNKLPDEQYCKIMKAICAYALNGELLELDTIESVIFGLIKPQIDTNAKRYENGCKGAEHGAKGGAPKGNQNARKNNPKTTPKQPQTTPNNEETTPNDNDNVNVNDNDNVNVNDIEKDNKLSKKKSFVPPTLEEVQAYAAQRGREDLAQAFFDFFEAGDWHDSNGAAVKNWKQKFVTWEQHNAPKKKQLYATPKVYSCED